MSENRVKDCSSDGPSSTLTVTDEQHSKHAIQRRKDGGVRAPQVNLSSLFPSSDDELEGTETGNGSADGIGAEEEEGEIQELIIGGESLAIRQYSWHRANANQVWPGTFVLAEFLRDNRSKYQCSDSHASCILELGAATGALAIYLRKIGFQHIVTRYFE